MRQCPLKHKECPLKRQLVGRVVRSLEIQVAKATNRQKNGSAGESTSCVSIGNLLLQNMSILLIFKIQYGYIVFDIKALD